MKQTREIIHGDHKDIETLINGVWAVTSCNVELQTKDAKMDTTYYTLYETRGDLLDAAADAAINERPFYMSAQLADMNDQIKLIEHITDEVQADYFAKPQQANTQDVTKYFNGVKSTATDEWARRHL